MHIVVVTLFPAMIENFIGYGIPRKAMASGKLQVSTCNPRDYTSDVHRTVDDRPYGGGPGMVMKTEPLAQALSVAVDRVKGAPVVYLSPQGRLLDQQWLRERAANEKDSHEGLVLLCGRYEGIDERIVDAFVTEEISLGDYVLSGGELGAMAIVDGVSRLLPGVLGHEESANQDSFGMDGLLDCPHYTRPERFEGMEVPEVLRCGDHQRIAKWRREQSLLRTHKRRPDLLEQARTNGAVSDEEQDWLDGQPS